MKMSIIKKNYDSMNLPNKLTLLRVVLIPIFVLFFYLSFGLLKIFPLLIFIAASLTDAIDGHIARRDKLITDFGKFMDPLADKLLVSAAFICFIEFGYMSAWIVVLIISREFLISGFRVLAASKGITIAANSWGKVKTVFQMILIIIILMYHTGIFGFVYFFINPLIFVTVVLTIGSAYTYLRDNIKVML